MIRNLQERINEKEALITSEELPVVFADEGQMIQLLQNLVGNALKFCENTPIIHISAKEEKDKVILSIRVNL